MTLHQTRFAGFVAAIVVMSIINAELGVPWWGGLLMGGILGWLWPPIWPDRG